MLIVKKISRMTLSIIIKVSPVIASKIIYYRNFKKRLNLKSPNTFNEKLMWLKLYEDDSLKTKCTDKYLVRDYIKELGYSEILIPLYKVYDRVEDLNFNQLPKSFVMKCTHGSGFNIVCSNKDQLDKYQTISQLNKWMKVDYSLKSCEPHYSKIKPRIILEKFLIGLDGKLPIDYKIHCFHGEPKIIEVVLGRSTTEEKFIMFSCEWELLEYTEDSMKSEEKIEKPRKLNEMLEISRDLSSEFTYVRVDLYYFENEIYFGELTFTPSACMETILFDTADYQIGKLLDLEKLSKYREPLLL